MPHCTTGDAAKAQRQLDVCLKAPGATKGVLFHVKS
jgi:hypothetical protein